MNVIGYIRTSTDRQDLSPEAQRAALRVRADQRGWSLTFIEDTCSGAKPLHKRDGGAQALALLDAGDAGALAVMRLDRLSRSTVDFGGIVERARRTGRRKQPWAVIVLDLDIDMTTPNGELVANVVVSVAQWERRMISQRTKDGLAVKKSQGVSLGGRRFATSNEAAARMVLLRNEGLTLQQVADRLNTDEVPTALGGRWHASTVRSVLRRHAAA